jgi:nucleotide-binding universal stress UspA family protein
LRKSTIPVLTVCRVVKPIGLRRILFATDLSQTATQGFGFALKLAQTAKSELTLMHVVDQTYLRYGGAEIVPDLAPELAERAESELTMLKSEADKHNVSIETILVEGIPAEEILRAADRQDADLILINIGRKALVDRALLGTTAERIIREARVPVLSIPLQRDSAQRPELE